MPHRGETPQVDTSGVEEVGWEELEPIWAEGMRASPEIQDEEEVRQLVAAQHRRRIAVDVRYFAARADGRIASYCELFSDGTDGSDRERDDARRIPSARPGQGDRHACPRGVPSGRPRLHLPLAEAEDWPKELYRKLGFETIGSIWAFLLQRA